MMKDDDGGGGSIYENVIDLFTMTFIFEIDKNEELLMLTSEGLVLNSSFFIREDIYAVILILGSANG